MWVKAGIGFLQLALSVLRCHSRWNPTWSAYNLCRVLFSHFTHCRILVFDHFNVQKLANTVFKMLVMANGMMHNMKNVTIRTHYVRNRGLNEYLYVFLFFLIQTSRAHKAT